jgi:transglutaminase-like putative cysteine protease
MNDPIHLNLLIELNYEIDTPGCDFIFSIHAAQTPYQRVLDESVKISQNIPYTLCTVPESQARLMRVQAYAGLMHLQYSATVALSHYYANPDSVNEVPVALLPPSVLPYLYPSRYCQSDEFTSLANLEFGHISPGYQRVQAISDWVVNHVTYEKNSSISTTSAVQTQNDRVGVCRDFAHLMITFCRALNMPARFVTGIDYGASPSLGPTDFHAYVEVYLSDRWYIFDPSRIAIPMGLIRLGTGRDAADSGFSMIFGNVRGAPPLIRIDVVENTFGILSYPQHVERALSTSQ